ncbi:MAG: element excision factor XisH family protein [Dolichospermum sp.]
MRYIFSGQDARTTRVSSFNFVLHQIGNRCIYLYLLEATAPDRKLYIAISETAYKSFFTQDVIQLILNRHQLPVIVVDIETEEIKQWIN